MSIASVSLSPVVVLQQLSENQLKHQVEKKVLSDTINTEAQRTVKTVSTVSPSDPKEELPVRPRHNSIDFRA
jgi:hypothetical protein